MDTLNIHSVSKLQIKPYKNAMEKAYGTRISLHQICSVELVFEWQLVLMPWQPW